MYPGLDIIIQVGRATLLAAALTGVPAASVSATEDPVVRKAGTNIIKQTDRTSAVNVAIEPGEEPQKVLYVSYESGVKTDSWLFRYFLSLTNAVPKRRYLAYLIIRAPPLS